MKQLLEFVDWVNTVKEVEFLTEGKGHMDHPEDMVILGSLPGYKPLAATLASMDAVAKNPKAITVKFDGYPALIFGSGPDGKFQIMDKHMFNRGANRPAIYSPDDFAKYEGGRGERGRSGLVQTVAKLWSSLEASYNGPGWYMGDLLFEKPLKDEGGVYRFRPNPNGIEYQVDVDSELGKYLGSKDAAIAVHRWLDPEAQTTEDRVTWLSDLGNLRPSGNVAILPVKMPVVPKVSLDSGLRSAARSTASSAGDIAKFISDAPQAAPVFAGYFTTYLNSRIVAGNLSGLYSGFYKWIAERLDRAEAEKKMSSRMAGALRDYLKQNTGIVKRLFADWIAVYKYKMSIYQQLASAAERSPIRGYLQSGKPSQEGFVFDGLKFIDREGFSAQNLAAKVNLGEAAEAKNTLVVYPGGFHPFHRGHQSVYNGLAEKFGPKNVWVAATNTTTERPFSFVDKKFLAGQSGVPANRFVQVKSPYRAEEITSAYDPDNTVLVFAVSEKDRDRFSFGPKKDGSAPYFLPWEPGVKAPFKEHAYIYVVPKVDFTVAGQKVDSASRIRSMYADGNNNVRNKIVADLYPGATKPKQVRKVLDSVLGGLQEADNPNYFGGSSASPIPGTPGSLTPGPTPEDVKRSTKELADLRRFMGYK